MLAHCNSTHHYENLDALISLLPPMWAAMGWGSQAAGVVGCAYCIHWAHVLVLQRLLRMLGARWLAATAAELDVPHSAAAHSCPSWCACTYRADPHASMHHMTSCARIEFELLHPEARVVGVGTNHTSHDFNRLASLRKQLG